MTRDELATTARKMRERAVWTFEDSVECAALEVTHIAKQISKALGEVSVVEAKQAIVREFIERLDLPLTATLVALAAGNQSATKSSGNNRGSEAPSSLKARGGDPR
jgi:hypothetical protein